MQAAALWLGDITHKEMELGQIAYCLKVVFNGTTMNWERTILPLNQYFDSKKKYACIIEKDKAAQSLILAGHPIPALIA